MTSGYAKPLGFQVMLAAAFLFVLISVPCGFAELTNDFISDRVQQLKTALTLSDDQVGKIQTALHDAMPPANQPKIITSSDRRAFEADQHTRWEEAEKKINSSLTAQQRLKYVDFLSRDENLEFWGTGSDAWRNTLNNAGNTEHKDKISGPVKKKLRHHQSF